MSLNAVGVLDGTVIDSVSLLSHCESNQSTLDSPAVSIDSLYYEHDLMPHKILKINTFETYKLPVTMRNNKHSECLEVSDDNENNVTIIPSDKRKLHENFLNLVDAKDNKMATIVKRKLSKSQTFDESSSVLNSRKKFTNFHDLANNIESLNKKDARAASQECVISPGCYKVSKEAAAGRLRFDRHHSHDRCACHGTLLVTNEHGCHKSCIPEGYQIHTQRNDILIRDLKRQVRNMKITCDEKDREISMYKQHVDENTSKLVQVKDEELNRLREELKHVKLSYDEISNFCEESITTASLLERKTDELKHAMDDKEKQHQTLYLEMYKKGQDSARFEHEEERETLSKTEGCAVTISELVRKLARTELELAKWQTLQRQESYNSTSPLDAGADTTLRFLKDSLFHYITDERDSDHHLRAMIRMLKYSDQQMTSIKESKLIQLMEKRNKKCKNRFYHLFTALGVKQ